MRVPCLTAFGSLPTQMIPFNRGYNINIFPLGAAGIGRAALPSADAVPSSSSSVWTKTNLTGARDSLLVCLCLLPMLALCLADDFAGS